VNILFVHRNFPGQYKHLAPALAADPANAVIAIGDKQNLGRLRHPRVSEVGYKTPRAASPQTHHYLYNLENGVRRGQAVVRASLALRKRGFVPDLVCCNAGWGEGLFLKDVWPEARHLFYFEFFYGASGRDVNFDPEFPSSFDDRLRLRIKNAVHLLSLDAADWCVTPTRWQHATFPYEHQARMSVIHDGIDTTLCRPDPSAVLTLNDGTTFTRHDEVVTYVARNLEPYRGFHTMMRALPTILERRPRAHVLLVGGDEVSYGSKPKGSETWREHYLKEVSGGIDSARVHWLGRIPYAQLIRMFQVSSVHIYLTYPFVLSWSMLEAMSCGCLVVGSRTPPVSEVITDGRNGLLVDFFSPAALAGVVDHALADREGMASLRTAARQSIIERYDLKSLCLPAHLELARVVAAGGTPAASC
jgi:glycosyltransferase involved in cell wall biosynthesis